MPNAIFEAAAGNNCRVRADPRTPVIVGAGQIARSPADDREIADASDSVSLMAEATELALSDCGVGDWRSGIDTVAVVGGLWRREQLVEAGAAEVGRLRMCTEVECVGSAVEVTSGRFSI